MITRPWGGIWLLLAALAVAAVAATIASLDHLPFQDHPSHRYKNLVLLRYDQEPYYRECFRLNPGYPYQLSDYLLVGMARGLGLEAAYRVYYAVIYLGGFLLAYWWLLRAFAADPVYLLWGAFLSFSTYLLLGNENWLLGIVGGIAAMAVAKRTASDPRPRALVLELIVFVVLYYLHILAFALVLLATLVLLPLNRSALWRRALALGLILLLTGLWYAVIRPAGGGGEWQVVPFVSYRVQAETLLTALGGFWLAELPWYARAPFWILVALMPLRAVTNPKWPLTGRVLGVVFAFALLLIPRTIILGRGLETPDAVVDGAIFAVGQRGLYVAFLFLPLLLPVSRWWRHLMAVVMVGALLVTVPAAVELLTASARRIAPVIAECEQLDLDLRHQWVYPIILPPYNTDPAFHRLHAYAYAATGGADRYQFFFGQMVVVWRQPPPAPMPPWTDATYLSYRVDRVGDDILTAYRTVIVIGSDHREGFDWVVRRLAPLGFAVVRQGQQVAVLQRPAAGSEL